MSWLTELFSGGASQLVDSIGNAIDKNTTTKSEQQTLNNELRKAEMQYSLENKKLDNDMQTEYLKDTQSARDMNNRVNESANASVLSKNIAAYLAIGATVLTFGLFAVIILRKFDPETKDIVIYLLGALTTIITQIFSFYFGSSQGSKDKSQIIGTLKGN